MAILGVFLLPVVLLAGCTETVDTSARYVFSQHTIVSYLEAHPDVYSEYVGLLKKVPVSKRSQSTLYQLLSARGNYTVFAPTNPATNAHLDAVLEDEAKLILPELLRECLRNTVIMNAVNYNEHPFVELLEQELPL